MGQGSSQPSPSSTQHVFTSETPVRFSQDLVDSLQASPESDSTRSKDLELIIQTRVTAELSRLSESTNATLSALEDQISSPDPPQPDTPSLGGAISATKLEPDLGRESVQREIDRLKRKLGARKVKEDVVKDEELQNARSKVLTCLRINDRRPLNCWEEAEAFRKEVARLEKGFLERVLE